MTVIVKDTSTGLRMSYSILGKSVSDAPDIILHTDPYGRAIAETYRPIQILVTYERDPGQSKWETPWITVIGRRVRKDGALGKERHISYSNRLANAPQWVQDFVGSHKPPRVTVDPQRNG